MSPRFLNDDKKNFRHLGKVLPYSLKTFGLLILLSKRMSHFKTLSPIMQQLDFPKQLFIVITNHCTKSTSHGEENVITLAAALVWTAVKRSWATHTNQSNSRKIRLLPTIWLSHSTHISTYYIPTPLLWLILTVIHFWK